MSSLDGVEQGRRHHSGGDQQQGRCHERRQQLVFSAHLGGTAPPRSRDQPMVLGAQVQQEAQHAGARI